MPSFGGRWKSFGKPKNRAEQTLQMWLRIESETLLWHRNKVLQNGEKTEVTMPKPQTYCPEIPFLEVVYPPEKKKNNRVERSRDSEGRYAGDVEIPNKDVFEQTEKRREESVWITLRNQDEKILKLEKEIRTLKNELNAKQME